jgi:hypothetical protein
MSESPATIFAGLSRVTYLGEPLDLGHGIFPRSSYVGEDWCVPQPPQEADDVIGDASLADPG